MDIRAILEAKKRAIEAKLQAKHGDLEQAGESTSSTETYGSSLIPTHDASNAEQGNQTFAVILFPVRFSVPSHLVSFCLAMFDQFD